jgi:hypothetical protein
MEAGFHAMTLIILTVRRIARSTLFLVSIPVLLYEATIKVKHDTVERARENDNIFEVALTIIHRVLRPAYEVDGMG